MIKKTFLFLLIFVFGNMLYESNAGTTFGKSTLESIDSKISNPHRLQKEENTKVFYEVVNSLLMLSFQSSMSNVEISLYKDGVLIIDEQNLNLEAGSTRTYDLTQYGKGDYTVCIKSDSNVLQINIK